VRRATQATAGRPLRILLLWLSAVPAYARLPGLLRELKMFALHEKADIAVGLGDVPASPTTNIDNGSLAAVKAP